MKKLNVLTVVGTRPEIIRLSRVLCKLDAYFDHKLVHTGQNYDYELNQIFFEDLGIRKPDYFLNAAGQTGAETIGKVIIEVDKLLRKIMPDALLVLGDTNSCLSVLSAKRLRIPTFHLEAGNRCFDMRVPEEINRKLVDHISDINLTYSNQAKEFLVSEGFPKDRVFKVGSPMFEVLNFHKENINQSEILKKLELKESRYFLVSAHREENIEPEKSFKKLCKLLNNLARQYDLPVIVSTHPRTRKKLDSSNLDFDTKIRFLNPLGFTDYNKLQVSAKVVLSDSGTITEESSILNFRAINLREVHERHEGMEEASVMMTGLKFDRVKQAIDILETQEAGEVRTLSLVEDYSKPNVSEKVVRIIQSYRDYIMRNVWKEFN